MLCVFPFGRLGFGPGVSGFFFFLELLGQETKGAVPKNRLTEFGPTVQLRTKGAVPMTSIGHRPQERSLVVCEVSRPM